MNYDVTELKKSINNFLFMTLHEDTPIKELESIALAVLERVVINYKAHAMMEKVND